MSDGNAIIEAGGGGEAAPRKRKPKSEVLLGLPPDIMALAKEALDAYMTTAAEANKIGQERAAAERVASKEFHERAIAAQRDAHVVFKETYFWTLLFAGFALVVLLLLCYILVVNNAKDTLEKVAALVMGAVTGALGSYQFGYARGEKHARDGKE